MGKIHNTCNGWAVKTRLGIDVRTVSDTRRAALVNWIVAGRENPRKRMVTSGWVDQEIEEAFQDRAAAVDAKVIEVVISESDRG